MFKTGLIGILVIFSAMVQANSPYRFDQIREEIKEMAQKDHHPVSSYSAARRVIMQNVHLESDNRGYFVRDVYCKIKYRAKVGPNTMPDHRKINIEHTWPKSRFGSSKGSSKYRVQVSDLHHLFPTDSVTNSKRSSYKFSQFEHGEVVSENCPYSKLDYSPSGGMGFEPPEEHKGNVARALFYFAVRYDLRISDGEEFFLRQWNIMDPVDAEEIARNDEIELAQGNRNPFVDDPEMVELIQDF